MDYRKRFALVAADSLTGAGAAIARYAGKSAVMREPLRRRARLTVPAVEVVNVERVDVAGMSRCLHVTELREWTGKALRTVRAAFDAAGLRPSGPGMSLIRPRAEGTLDVTAGYPVCEAAQWSPLIVEVVLGGGAARTVHLGPYDSIQAAYDLLIEWLSGHHRKVGSLMWEEYLVGPDDTAAAAG